MLKLINLDSVDNLQCIEVPWTSAFGSECICISDHCTWGAYGCLRRHQSYSWGIITTLSCCLSHVWFSDENSNQSSVSDVYQLKVDSSTSSSPSPQQSESLSPAHTSDFRTDDSQPPTLGQEILEGKPGWASWRGLASCCWCFSSLE